MSFLVYLIKIISLYIILLLYYESKNFNLFEFHLAIADIDIIDIIDEDIELSRDGYIIAITSYAIAACINYIIVLIIILRIVSSFINNRDLINRSYMAFSTNVSDVSYIIIEIIKLAKNLNRINIFSIDSEFY